MAIKASLVNKLVEIFGGVSRPALKSVRKLVDELKFVYPNMFKEEIGTGYGLGGFQGPDGFASQVLD